MLPPRVRISVGCFLLRQDQLHADLDRVGCQTIESTDLLIERAAAELLLRDLPERIAALYRIEGRADIGILALDIGDISIALICRVADDLKPPGIKDLQNGDDGTLVM